MTNSQLNAWRQRMGFTQQRAAEVLGIAAPYYRELESGRRAIREVYAFSTRYLECVARSRKKSSGAQK
ncbi:MAG: helix-turn-helix domain-containing protein [Terriglobia bacterium]